jgi:hypothetical protein
VCFQFSVLPARRTTRNATTVGEGVLSGKGLRETMVVATIGDVVFAPGNMRVIEVAVEPSHACTMPLWNPWKSIRHLRVEGTWNRG